MSEEVNELLDSFLSLCLEQRQLTNSETGNEETVTIKKDELKASSLELAKKLYTKAAELERSGDISKGNRYEFSLLISSVLAMELYNRAYRLDPEIDRNIDHERVAVEISQKDLSEIESYYNPFRKLALQNDPIDRDLFLQISKQTDKSEDKTIENEKGVFRIAFKEQPNLLKELPEDVLGRVLELLGWMNLPSLEALSTTSRSIYLACRQESLWKVLCSHMACNTEDIRPLSFDCWRLQYIMRPAFRCDGLYISKITYFRQGHQESAISQPSHLVTYYRYLRFFNGPASKRLVLALVSTDKPKQVIEQLKEIDEKAVKAVSERIFLKKPNDNNNSMNSKRNNWEKRTFESLSKANMFVGTYWRHPEDPTDRLFSLLLFDAHSKSPMRLKMTMELADPLKGMPAHRTAKCTEYRGRVEAENERNVVDFDVHNWGKFYFSRVKSYT